MNLYLVKQNMNVKMRNIAHLKQLRWIIAGVKLQLG